MERIELEDFLKFKAVSSLAWSPDGKRAAFLVHQADREHNAYASNLWLYEAGQPLRQLTSRGDVKSFVWDSPDAIVFPALREEADRALRAGGEDHTVFYSLSLSGGCAQKQFSVPLNADAIGKLDRHVYVLQARVDLQKEERLHNLTGAARQTELAAIRDEASRFVVLDEYPFWFNGVGVTNKTRVGLWLYNSQNGSLKRITPRLYDVEAARVCPGDGVVVYHGREFETLSNFRTGINVYTYADGVTKTLLDQGVYRIRQVDWMDGRVVFAGTDMSEYNYSQTPSLWTIDYASGQIARMCPESMSIGNPVGSDSRYGGGISFKTDGHLLYMISGIADASRLITVDPSGVITPLLEKDGSIDLFDVHDGKVLFVAMHDMRLQELYRLSAQGGERLSSFNEAYFTSHSVVAPEKISFTDPDGFEIHGFILKPVGFEPGKRYPGILDIHGGPRLSYGAVYTHEMQYWANKGYFVFFANPRGSDARGDEFAYIRGKYGTVEYANLMQFTDKVLEAYPQIDAKRLGVAGGSYGGFMTNWIIGHTDRFAAAASQRSIANYISMEGTSDCGRTFVDGHLGTYTAVDMHKLWAQSPLSAADKCVTPTLFIHSEEDYRCWKIEGLQMFNALRANGVDARLCLFKGENHELSRSGKPANRIKRLQEITGWLDRYLQSGQQ